MRKSAGVSLAGLVIGLSLLVGCLEGSVDACRDDSSCQAGYVCAAGICQRLVCQVDEECSPGWLCVHGVCTTSTDHETDGGVEGDGAADSESAADGDASNDEVQDAEMDAGSDQELDVGNDQDLDAGNDAETDAGDDAGCLPDGVERLIEPGVGVGELRVSQQLGDAHTLQAVRDKLGELGQATSASFTFSFLNDALWVTGIDSNGDKSFDASDRVISLVVRACLNAHTKEGLGVGAMRTEVHSQQAFANPEHAAELPAYQDFRGGKLDEYFSKGLFVSYDEQDRVISLTVTRPYVVPEAQILPQQASLRLSDTVMLCGNGYQTGSKRDVHRGVFGEPDGTLGFSAQVGNINIKLYADSYRILGLEFFGGEDKLGMFTVDRLVTIVMYPLFYGQTSAGNSIGSSKQSWQAEMGEPVAIQEDPEYGKVFVYAAGSYYLGIMYTNDGASDIDVAVLLLLNYLYQEP